MMETKIPIQNIYYMLAYAYQTLNLSEYKKLGSEEFTHVLELYAEILSIGIPVLIRSGLTKTYRSVNENSTVLRGKIDIASSIKQSACLNKQLVVTYDTLSEDHFLNQIIKATLIDLSRAVSIRKEHRKKLLNYLSYFSQVSDIKLTRHLWKKFQYNRQNSRYQFLIDICRFIYEALLLNESVQTKKRQHIQDDQQLASLYEKFIFSFYKKETAFSVSRPQIKWTIDDDFNQALPIMQTDLVLKKGHKTLIVDTKFYTESMIAKFENSALKQIPANLYQIFAYIHNWKPKKDEVVGGMLLYAKTKAINGPNHRYQIKGKTILVKSLDLNQNFVGIKHDLISFANDYFDNKC